MSKYDSLKVFLARNPASEAPMQFSDIEQIVGFPLPIAAFRHRAWWSNNASNNVMTRAWLDAGYRTERVDMAGQKLVFRRSDKGMPPAASIMRRPSLSGKSDGDVIGALRRALGGTARITAGADLTASTGEAWDAETE